MAGACDGYVPSEVCKPRLREPWLGYFTVDPLRTTLRATKLMAILAAGNSKKTKSAEIAEHTYAGATLVENALIQLLLCRLPWIWLINQSNAIHRRSSGKFQIPEQTVSGGTEFRTNWLQNLIRNPGRGPNLFARPLFPLNTHTHNAVTRLDVRWASELADLFPLVVCCSQFWSTRKINDLKLFRW